MSRTLIRMIRTLIRMISTLIQAIRSLIRITRKLSLPQWRAEQRAAGRRPFEGDLRGRPVELHRHFIAYRAPPHAVRATHSHAQPRTATHSHAQPSMQHGVQPVRNSSMPSEQRNYFELLPVAILALRCATPDAHAAFSI
jgi:hypothetical protein